MGKKRMIFYGIFGAYQLIGFIFTVVIDSNTSILFKMAAYVSWFKYLSFIGVVLIIVDFVWSWRQSRRVEKEAEEFRKENNNLKARIYDFQENKKHTVPASSK